ncbi:hypothetical protein ABZW03_28095 [Kitasatospora sp. NPDC004799]|uniref:hypothetical protein n=1 Tax=Kitasatospora sp. NPDC004799 TaxID=3154460 RepID=UPI0033A7D96D
MVSDGSWYVLVERDRRVTEEGAHRWQLASSQEAPRGREQAVALAEEAARTYVPREGSEPDGPPMRRIFKMPDGSFLVELSHRGWRRHVRVSVAELLHSGQDAPPEPRPPAPPRDAARPRRGLFGRR